MRLNKSTKNVGLLMVVAFVFTGVGQAATITVCSVGCDYTLISVAISVANTGDTIEVKSGTYYDAGLNVNKKLILRGVDSGGGKSVINSIILSADGITLEGFVLIGSSGDGISVTSNNNIITGNIISNFDVGVRLNSNYNNILNNNNISNNRRGLNLEYSNNNTVSDNIVNFSNYEGIGLHYSHSNTFSGNIVNANNYEGIGIFSSSNNLIYLNNLINNTPNAYSDSANNFWDNDIYGNHYSNFDEPIEGCSDMNSNNICDSSYNNIGASNVDRYPLVSWIAPTPPNSVHYTATVTTTQQNTFIQDVNGSFGSIRVGQSRVISNSVILNNTGDANATVDAKFINNQGGIYGLVSGGNVLNASNFAFGTASTGSWTFLDNSGSNVNVATVPFDSIIALDARLDVPPNQTPGDYSGIVILTFSNTG